jgi:tripartite-type tricarboxylate transporter receptor subunit TctC
MNVPLLGLTFIAAAASAGVTSAQSYPSHPIRIVIAQTAGSAPDIVARLLAPRLSESLGQQIIVDNRPGANGIIGMDLVAKAKPDGYTFVLAVPSALTMNPYVYKQLPYNAVRDFVPITQTASNTFGLIINPSLPARTVKELVALGRARPGELNYGSSGIANQTHLAGELFAIATGIKMSHVPYKGQSLVLTDLMSGQISLSFAPMPGTTQHVESGRLRLLATCGENRDALFRNTPTMIESGYPTVIVTGWNGLLGPAGLPREIGVRLQREIARYLAAPDVRDAILKQGGEPVGSTPEAFAAFVKAEHQKWSGVIKRAGLEFTQ